MKPKRFTEEQTIGILKQAQAGMRIVDLCFYTWRTKYGGMEGNARSASAISGWSWASR